MSLCANVQNVRCNWIIELIRDFQKAADAAFQDRSIEELEEVQAKVVRFHELTEHVMILKSKLGYR